jgi:hypothetical protein
MGRIHRQKQDHGVDIKGKLYSKVQDRVEVFRIVFGDTFGIDTFVDYNHGFGDGAPIIATAKISNAEGRIIASGYACEFIGTSRFTSYNPIEVAETSAIGRALAAFGLHGGEYASAEEIEYAEDKEINDRRPAPNGPDERERFRQVEEQQEGFYIPDDDTTQINPEREQSMVLDQIDRIDNINDLGEYWSLVKGFVMSLNKGNQHLAAEIKAAFATANNALGGKR